MAFPLTGRTRYLFALLTAGAGVAALLLFPGFFNRSFLAAGCILLICLLAVGAWRLERVHRLSAAGQQALAESDARFRRVLEQASGGMVLAQVEAALRQREDQLERITSAVPGVVYQYVRGPDGAGKFAYVSERARELFGVSAGEILEDPARLQEVVDPEDEAAAAPLFEASGRSLEPYSFDFRVRRAAGAPARWLRAIASPVREQDSVIWNGVVVDITEQRRLEEELRQSQKMESLGRLAGGVAHDFNNVLTVIRGYADVLSSELSPEDPRRSDVGEIRRAADRATSLTQQLLAMSRRQVLVPREVDLNSLVCEIERMLRRVIGENIHIVTEPGPNLGWVRADPGQLEHVLLNLTVNARDAMPEGGTLTIATSHLRVEAGREDPAAHGVAPGDYVVLRVSDTGSGMAPEIRGKIFEPFFTTKAPGEGTGLGLSTAYGIVQQSNGSITVESEPGAGSSFRIFLPRVRLPGGVPSEARAALVTIPSEGGRATILLVEDDDGVRRLTCRILEQYGYVVVEAQDGAEALELSSRRGQAIDAVVSDVVMPGISGPELISRLRERWPEVPALLLSGYTGDEVQGELPWSSRQAFLRKPFSADSLAAALEELLADTGGIRTRGHRHLDR